MIRFVPATAADHEAILALNESAIPAVNRIDHRTLADLHDQAELLLVARSAEDVAGFLLVLNETATYGSINYRYFCARYDRFAYVDRIVVGAPYRRLGVGSGLYAALFEAAAHLPRITCEVNVAPPNPGSLQFHMELGFRVVGEQDTEGGSKRVALMVREQTR